MNVVYAHLTALCREGVDKKLHRILERMAKLEWNWSGHTDAR